MYFDEYAEHISAYKNQVLQGIAAHRNGLMHPNPMVVMQAAIQLQEQIANAGGIVVCLRREGYTNNTFYNAVNWLAQTMYEAAMSVDCGGLSPRFIAGLESVIKKLEPDIKRKDIEQACRRV